MMREKLVFAAMLLAVVAAPSRSMVAQTALPARAPALSVSPSSSGRKQGFVAASGDHEPTRPFSTWRVGLKASTLGAGADLATPLGRSFDLRGNVNVFDFAFPFSIDGVGYDSQFHLRSGGLNLDWIPRRGGFRISPGVLYFKSSLSAISGVPSGRYFELGGQGFINSVDDPLNGTAAVVFPHRLAPMVTFGFSNLIPGKGRLTFPAEFGLAYTGAARIDVTLNGTACTLQGCFTFANNAEAQDSMKAEIRKLNNNLERYPVYPIVSFGVAYRF